MGPQSIESPGMELGDFIEAYESAQAQNGQANLADFLPPESHPLYPAVLRELVRVDMEYGWQRGRPIPLADYRRRFPKCLNAPIHLQEIAFEEYRLRQQAGENPSPSDYQRQFGVRTESWPPGFGRPRSRLRMIAEAQAAAQGANGHGTAHSVPSNPPVARPPAADKPPDDFVQVAQAYQEYRRRHHPEGADDLDAWLSVFRGPGEASAGDSAGVDLFQDLHRSDPAAASRLAEAVTSLPEEGVEFLGFRLLKELGQGAFARVYLAQQSGLANRYVALKVAADLHGESQTLAQLQHTNIMPIYSIHHATPFQAVCMPYFGSTTLAHILKDIEGRPSLPESGKGLVSTLDACKQSTRKNVGASKSSPSHPAAEKLAAELPEEVLALPSGGDSTDTLRQLEGMTYVEAVLWMAARLADGLSHAHERGIHHLDLKPANILLTDEGQPMLLDFNLSQDVKRAVNPSAAYIGGTLPYMAPEHLEAFRGGDSEVDARSDLFSFGVIIFELLTGRSPYLVHRGHLAAVLTNMIEDRRQRPPRVRTHNKAVSPAVEAIVRRCLEADPDQRYQTAAELHEDLKRHLDSLPLRYTREPSLLERGKKWVRRHPFLTSTSTLVAATVLLVVICGSVVLWNVRELGLFAAQQDARDSWNQLREDSYKVNDLLLERRQLDSVFAQSCALLDRYQVGQADWQSLPRVQNLAPADQAELHQYLAEAAMVAAEAQLLKIKYDRGATPPDEPKLAGARAYHQLAASFYPADHQPVSLLRQAADLAKLGGEAAEASKLQKQADQTAALTVRDLCWQALRLGGRGQYKKALAIWQEALRQDPKNFRIWYSVGDCYTHLSQDAADGGQYNEQNVNQDQEAVAHLSGAIALSPKNHRFYMQRGYAYLRLKNFELARADFDYAIHLNSDRPALAEAYLHRGIAQDGLKHYAEAVGDWNRALELDIRETRVWYLLSRAKERQAEKVAAARDFEEFMHREPTDARSWATRGYAKLPKDPKGALADFDQALEREPFFLKALLDKAYVLSELLGRTEEAVQVLDILVAEHADFIHGRASRAVLLARLGKRDAARQDVEAILASAEDRSGRPLTLYQAACALALTSRTQTEDRAAALRLLSESIRQGLLSMTYQGYSGIALLEKDPDLNPLRDQAEFRRLLEAARTLNALAVLPKS